MVQGGCPTHCDFDPYAVDFPEGRALPTSDPEREHRADRLRAFIREHHPGGCRWLSAARVGTECLCPLCDVDALVRAPVPQEPK